MHYALILAAHHVHESNMQQQIGWHPTPTFMTWALVVVIVAAVSGVVRNLFT